MASAHRVLFLLLLALLPAAATAAPLEAYGKLPNIEAASLSASGGQVAVIVTNGEERRLVVKDLAQNKVTFLATVGHAKVRDLRWAGDQHLILTNSHTEQITHRGELFYASDIDLKTKQLHPLLMNSREDTFGSIAGYPRVRMIGGQPMVFVDGFQIVNSRFVYTLIRVDLARGTSRVQQDGVPYGYEFVVGPDGRLLAEEFYHDATGKWSLRFPTATGWREVLVRDEATEPPGALGLGRDGNSILVQFGEKDGFAWHEVALDTGAVGPEIPHEDGQAAIDDPLTGRMLGVHALVGDENRYTFFDPADARVWRAVEAAFPGSRVELRGWSNDRQKILVRVDSPTDGPAYSIIDLPTRTASWLGDEYLGVKAPDISPVRAIAYKAADGLPLSGYLTLPRGREPKALPLIVFPHGGPAGRDKPGFDWWAQGMASRGYAVLQVNFRGSAGLGWDFQKAGFGEWGRKMQTDLSDGVRHLAAQGVVDPKRVCIVGASYGGYAALAAATLDPSVYRCAVAFGGISDLRKMLSTDRDYHGEEDVRYYRRYIGADGPGAIDPDTLSPARLASRVSAPILLIHGRNDSVVFPEQSEAMADALKRAGKPYELLMLDNSDHWLSLGDTRLQTLKATMAFVEKNNPPN